MTPTPQDAFFFHSPGTGDRLRIGLLLDSYVQPAWVYRILAQIAASDFCCFAVIVRNGLPAPAPPPGGRWLRRLRLFTNPEIRKHLLYTAYLRFDNRFNPIPPEDDPFTPIDCASLLTGVPELTQAPKAGKFTHRFSGEDVAAVQAHKPDVLLRFGFNIIRGPMLTAARYGMWSFHHGDNDVYRGGPAHFWEIVERSPVTGVLLQVLSEELDGGLVLAKGVVSTEQGISLRRNRRNPYWAGSPYVIRKLWELHTRGWESLQANQVPNRPTENAKKIYRRPVNGQVLRFLTKPLLQKAVRGVMQRLTGGAVGKSGAMDEWRVAVRRGGQPLWDAPAGAAAEFHWMKAPAGRFFADPFLLPDPDGGAPWLLMEDYRTEGNKGVLACAQLNPDRPGSFQQEPATILERPFHLSYPHAFVEDGVYYMTPEMGANRAVELYRAPHPAGPWEKDCALLTGVHAVDPTVWREGERWWMLVTLWSYGKSASELWLFTADRLRGPWLPEQPGPVSLDVRHSRPGGAVYITGGRRFRISQDCSVTYGYRIGRHEITGLGAGGYQEQPAGELVETLFPGCRGIHTYNRLGEWEVIDGKFGWMW